MNHGPQEFLATADAIGSRLCRDALWAGSRCNWVGSSMEFVDNAWRPVHRAFGGEFYNGTSGIALFFSRLFALTQVKDYRRCAEGARAIRAPTAPRGAQPRRPRRAREVAPS